MSQISAKPHTFTHPHTHTRKHPREKGKYTSTSVQLKWAQETSTLILSSAAPLSGKREDANTECRLKEGAREKKREEI